MTSDSEPIREDNQTPDAKGKANIETGHADPNISPTPSVPKLPPAKTRCEITCKPEKDWWDKSKKFVEIAGVLILGVYTWYTIKIYYANHDAAIAAQKTLCEIQKQTRLMRQETIGNQGAVLVFDPAISVPAIVAAVRPIPGRVTAKDVEVRMTVQRISLPEKQPIGKPIPCDISVPQVAGGESPNLALLSGSIHACYLPDFNQSSANEIMHTRQSVAISGTFSYDNGFGEIISQKFCRMYLGYRFSGFISGDKSHPTSGEDASFHDCDDFDGALRRALDFKKKYGDSYIAQDAP